MAIKPSTDLLTQFGHAYPTGQTDLDGALRTKIVRIKLPADAAANTQTEHLLAMSEGDLVLQQVRILPQGAVAADNTDYVTIALQTGDLAAGALATAVASKDTRAASLNGLAANTVAVIGTGLASACAASRRISLNVTKSGAGKQMPVLLVELTYQVA
jgi:hypothetical protein